MMNQYLLPLVVSVTLSSVALYAQSSTTETEPFNPFAEVERMHKEITRIFDDFHQKMRLDSRFDRFDPFKNGGLSREPSVDIQDKGKHYEVTANIPGADSHKINIEAKNGMLKISATTQKQTEKKEGDSYLRQERYMGSYTRILSLPEDADQGKVDYTYKDGVLRVTIGKVK